MIVGGIVPLHAALQGVGGAVVAAVEGGAYLGDGEVCVGAEYGVFGLARP